MFNDYLNIKYLPGGDKKTGCDCWGLVKLIYKEKFNIELPDYYEQYKKVDIAEDHLIKAGKWEKIPRFDSPSISLFSQHNNEIVDHVAFNINEFKFIHITRTFGKPFITRFSDFMWKEKLRGFYKYVQD